MAGGHGEAERLGYGDGCGERKEDDGAGSAITIWAITIVESGKKTTVQVRITIQSVATCQAVAVYPVTATCQSWRHIGCGSKKKRQDWDRLTNLPTALGGALRGLTAGRARPWTASADRRRHARRRRRHARRMAVDVAGTRCCPASAERPPMVPWHPTAASMAHTHG